MPFHLLIAQAAPSSGGPMWQQIVVTFGPFLLIIVVMYYLLFRNQQKQANQRKEMLAALKAGSKVVTSGGIYATIDKVKDKTFIVRINDNVKIEISRSAVSGTIDEKGEEITIAVK